MVDTRKTKKYSEFTEEEKIAIVDFNRRWFVAEMSDSYSVTCKEESELLSSFNQKFNYNFSHFHSDWYNVEESYFIY